MGGELSGSGTVAKPITNLGIIDAVSKLDLGGAVTGSGQLQISKRATLELGGPTRVDIVEFDLASRAEPIAVACNRINRHEDDRDGQSTRNRIVYV